jgi:putative peptidoglycan lipid II flippase
MKTKHAVRGALVNSALIMVSRILGLIRDVAMLAVFGLSPLLGAFNIAWVVPNMFRRLLGEGAVAAAVQPALARVEEDEGEDSARELFAGFQASVLSILLTVLAIAWVGLFVYRGMISDESALQTNLFYLLLLPYMVPICMCALASAPQNLHGHFFWPAVTGVILNACWLVTVFAASYWASNDGEQLQILCGGILFGGMLQWGAQLRGLKKIGWTYSLKWKAQLSQQKQTFVKFVPALIGLAALQVNLLADQFLVRFIVGPEANTFSYIANRLLQLPLALVGVAAMTGAMPLFARLAAKKDFDGMNYNLRRASELTVTIMLCAFSGLFVLALPAIEVLFEHGKVTAADSELLASTLRAYLWVLPIAGVSGLLTRGLQALHSYKLPMIASIVAVPVNLILDIVLLPRYGVVAAGWATSIALLVQLLVLSVGLRSEHLRFPLPPKSVWSWMLPAVTTFAAAHYSHHFLLVEKPLANLLLAIACGGVAALATMAVTRRTDLVGLLRAVRGTN